MRVTSHIVSYKDMEGERSDMNNSGQDDIRYLAPRLATDDRKSSLTRT